MTKKEMSQHIAEKVGVSQLQAQEIIQSVFDGITATLVQEGRIELRNFGIFEVRKRQARDGRNPRTGQVVKVPARMVVTFKPGRGMLERVRHICLEKRYANSRSPVANG